MTPLRVRMIEDMTLAGLAAGTQGIYLHGVRRLAAHYRRSPDQLSEAEVRAYLLALRERGVALGTFKTNHGGIQFLYRRTLERTGRCLGKKDSSPEAAAPAGRPVGRADPRPAGLRKEPDPQDLLDRHVCLRPAHQRGRDPGSQRDRQRQHAAARHRQGQQGTARAAASAGSGRPAQPLAHPSPSALAVPQS